MMTVVARYAPRQEIYSIDESFLDFDGVRGDLVAIGRAIRAHVLQWTGLPTSVGFGPTKTLAKLANHVAKMADRKPGSYPGALARVCHLGAMTDVEREAIFEATEIGDVWGIGRRMSARLNEGGIRSVAQLLRADPTTLRRQFSVVLEKTLTELRGTVCMGLDDAPTARQQIMCSRSFGAPATELAGLVEVVSQFAARVAEKVRQQQAVAGAVQVFISTSPFRTHDRQHSPSVTMPLVRPTDDTRTLIAAAVRALRGMFRPGFNYVKAGVMLIDLQPKGREQGELDLFSAIDDAESGVRHDPSALMETVDALNRRFGRGSVSIGSASSQVGDGVHAGKRERRSPRYTTRLDEIPVAVA
jgi:DNA polymerase V